MQKVKIGVTRKQERADDGWFQLCARERFSEKVPLTREPKNKQEASRDE